MVGDGAHPRRVTYRQLVNSVITGTRQILEVNVKCHITTLLTGSSDQEPLSYGTVDERGLNIITSEIQMCKFLIRISNLLPASEHVSIWNPSKGLAPRLSKSCAIQRTHLP